MAKVWLVEKDAFTDGSVASQLAGSCFLRLVASTGALKKLLSIEKESLPDLLLVNVPLNISELDELVELKTAFPVVVCLHDGLYEIAQMKFKGSRKHHFLNKDADAQFHVSEVIELIRHHKQDSFKLSYRDVTLLPRQLKFIVEASDSATELPLKEMQLLRLFMEKPGHILSREVLVGEVWGSCAVGNRTVDAHVSRLRSRLDGTELTIESVYRKGYQLV